MSGSADPADLARAQAPRRWPVVTESHPKPQFADDTEQASRRQRIHTASLTPYKAVSFDKLMPKFELPSPPATWCCTHISGICCALQDPPQKCGSCGAELNLPLYFPCLCRCTGKEQDTGASSPQACDHIISPSVTHPNHHSWRSCQQY